MRNIAKITTLFTAIAFFSTTTLATAFAEDDTSALKSEINQLKAKQTETELEALKKELSDLKIKMLEEKLANAEKRLDDKISTSEKRLDDKISTSEKQTDIKFEAKNDNIETKIQQSNSSVLNVGDKTTDAKTPAIAKPRPIALHIAAASSSMQSTLSNLTLSGSSLGLSYTKNRFFGELSATSMSEKYTTTTYNYGYGSYYSPYGYSTYSYDSTLVAKMQSVDLKIGYKLGGDIFKFEPYVGIGRGAMSFTGADESSTSYTQFTPGAKLSIGSSKVRGYLDVAKPSVVSKDENYDWLGYTPGAIAKIGLSFAF
jgi:hypothetical protein